MIRRWSGYEDGNGLLRIVLLEVYTCRDHLEAGAYQDL